MLPEKIQQVNLIASASVIKHTFSAEMTHFPSVGVIHPSLGCETKFGNDVKILGLHRSLVNRAGSRICGALK